MTLYNLSQEFEALYSQASGEDVDALVELYNELKCSLTEKLDNSAKVLKQLQSDAEAIKAEEVRLSARRKGIENNSERLKDMMLTALKSSGEAKTKTTLFSFSVRSSASVSITDESLLTSGYLRTTTTTAPDKKAIKETLDKGIDVEGAEIVYNESLQIK